MPEFIYKNKLYYNPVEFAMGRIGGTWKMPILWRLKDRVLRYGELKKDIPRITHKMLTSQLRELEAEGFILRQVHAVVPPKVEYSLTPRGKKVIPLIEAIRQYGLSLMKEEGITSLQGNDSMTKTVKKKNRIK
jgi:DNA-binding HxlR family transcriptional regulator